METVKWRDLSKVKEEMRKDFDNMNDAGRFEAFYLACLNIASREMLFDFVKTSMPNQSFSKIISLIADANNIHDVRVYSPYLKEIASEYETARNAFVNGDIGLVAKFFSKYSK